MGLLVFAEAVLGWFFLIPAVAASLGGVWPVKIWTLAVAVSVLFVLSIILDVAYAAWTTTLILNTVRQGDSDPIASLTGLRRWFWRVLGLELIGWGVLFAGLAVALALAVVALPLVLLLVGVGSVVWNLATSALLLVALDERLSFGEAVSRGLAVSWANKGRWWKPVGAQMLLLGLVTLIVVSYGDRDKKTGSYVRHENTNWGVNAFWTGGYERDPRWHGKLMDSLDAPTLSVVSTALGLVYGVLAIVVKLRIAQDVCRERMSTAEPNDFPCYPGDSGGDEADLPDSTTHPDEPPI